MEAHALRLNPGDDLRAALDAALKQRGAEAAFVVSGIGSLRGARIRYAGVESAAVLDGDLEILTLSGTLSPDGAHLHISVSDAVGQVRGGHVAPGCIVRTTAEILIAWLPEWRFAREHDPATGYPELVPRPRS
ncbi:putative DNA-binding protein with PD1-like motif [Variovorax boronicumulans]|uniref:PPC domain-containing DNA-binding protein n=1 Tax=Variovorax TaxID=34072 RepID=UPI00278A283E|nr:MULTISPECIES: PPC domain-containing DNA-binding protein [Variovorax]MDQ0038322.1 putative DNA-binding protein with PD1-like motif [Variovorax boronicumulans]MDQ0608589.1 putative DNA-binding protein with PD1-like motif [Variovorax sp. W1I1]